MRKWPVSDPRRIAVRSKAVDLLWKIGEDTDLPDVIQLEARRLAHIIETGAFTLGFFVAVDNTLPKL